MAAAGMSEAAIAVGGQEGQLGRPAIRSKYWPCLNTTGWPAPQSFWDFVASGSCVSSPRSTFHGESHFDGHLPVADLTFINIAARLDHLKPAQVLNGFVCALDGFADGILHGGGRGAGEFDELVDVILHSG